MKFVGMAWITKGNKETVATFKKGLSNAASHQKIEVATIEKFHEGDLIINDNRLLCLGR